MRNCLRTIVTVAIALLAGGCSFQAGYNPIYLSAQPMALGLSGKSLVVLEPADANWTFSGAPTSFTGGGTTLTIPIGEITKQIALRVFGAAFDGGADFRESAGATTGYRLVVKPKVSQFNYAYNQLKNLGFTITPQVEVELHVVLVHPSGSILVDKRYTSGKVDGSTYMISGQPAEKVNQILHQEIFKLMTDAALDAKRALDSSAT